MQPLNIFWVQSQRLWDNSYLSLRLSLITDGSKATDLFSPFHARNCKMLVQEDLRKYSETNALLSHMREQSSREVKGFLQGFIHDRAGTQIQIHIFLTPRPGIFPSICNTVWTFELACLGSNLGSCSWAILVMVFNTLSFSLLIWKLRLMLAYTYLTRL